MRPGTIIENKLNGRWFVVGARNLYAGRTWGYTCQDLLHVETKHIFVAEDYFDTYWKVKYVPGA